MLVPECTNYMVSMMLRKPGWQGGVEYVAVLSVDHDVVR